MTLEIKYYLYYCFALVNTQRVSDSVCVYQSVSLSPSSQSVLSSLSHLPLTFPFSSLSFHNTSSSSQSLLVRCTAMLLRSVDKEESHWTSWYFQLGVKTWSLLKSLTLYSCFRWSLNSLFITAFSSYCCEVIPQVRLQSLCWWKYQ
jgi:hypothetical protein